MSLLSWSSNLVGPLTKGLYALMADPKLVLRKQIKLVLNGLTKTQLASKSLRIAEQVLLSPTYTKCRNLSVFLSLPDEPDTLAIVKDALATGRKVFVPQLVPEKMRHLNTLQGNLSGMCMRQLYRWEQIEQWPMNKWRIRQPPPPNRWDELSDQAMEMGGLDLMLVPGLVFTRNGKRVGRGAGYYDRYLDWCFNQSRLCKYRYPTLLGLTFEEQVVDDVPCEPHDIQVDKVISA